MGTGLLQILGGLLGLYIGAEGLVRGSSFLALRLKVSPLVIGLTVVAFGTSLPELVVSVKTAITGQGAISAGNVVGSNIFNIALILGACALIRPLTIRVQLLRMDIPVLIFSALMFLYFFRDRHLGRAEGLSFLVLLGVYLWANIFLSKHAPAQDTRHMEKQMPIFRFRKPFLEILGILAGLGILVFGADLLVRGSVHVARILDLSEAVIGLTIVAAGTSLPELATSFVAAFRKEQDIATGNVIGSNIFNILGVLGVSSCIAPIQGSGIGSTDVLVMAGVSILLLPFLWSHFRLNRWEGGVLVLIYAGYLFHLVN
ncbi:MAG TPA: calcium/sodium antiporter [bacterium]|nr:calcium/sodium antiporter [bacterium]